MTAAVSGTSVAVRAGQVDSSSVAVRARQVDSVVGVLDLRLACRLDAPVSHLSVSVFTLDGGTMATASSRERPLGWEKALSSVDDLDRVHGSGMTRGLTNGSSGWAKAPLVESSEVWGSQTAGAS
eukprot:CAMPEP_0197387568 /NCGR_PEP_ID=MMETSP1165-20131217/602_1 /TAXON_ID=284809 /ORGANISM="Chrysocystis fragilis, Strain CCMP3189" /LENGTH=124 /DNA_ID=CAMNT_0042912897 /DNA_START=275 /DNA_END=647 /DNA_ORIENTATION=+